MSTLRSLDDLVGRTITAVETRQGDALFRQVGTLHLTLDGGGALTLHSDAGNGEAASLSLRTGARDGGAGYMPSSGRHADPQELVGKRIYGYSRTEWVDPIGQAGRFSSEMIHLHVAEDGSAGFTLVARAEWGGAGSIKLGWERDAERGDATQSGGSGGDAADGRQRASTVGRRASKYSPSGRYSVLDD